MSKNAMNILTPLAFFLLSVFFPSLQAAPYKKVSKPVTTQKTPTLHDIEAYLNSIHEFSGFFEQIAYVKREEHVEGKFWLKRPKGKTGKMRIDYAPGKGQYIFANHEKLKLYDLKEKSVDEYSSDSTPAHFILEKRIRLSKLDCKKITRRSNFLFLPIETDQAVVEFRFQLWETGAIKYLVGWTIIDGQGNRTEVHFHTQTIRINDPRTVPNKLFQDEVSFQKMVY